MSPFQALSLPNGVLIPNRIAKAAMEENMADQDNAPSRQLMELYRAWADGEAGLLLTGNVMIDRRAMTGPGGVVLEDERHLEKFRQWAAIGKAKSAQVWMQLNHPGRQTLANLGQTSLAPSAVALEMGEFSKLFAEPRPMTEADIEAVIARFARSAQLAEQAGFSGVQIHAAHGYLLSQFLSPLSPGFCVAVKLNSADFQRGGFDADDARQVIEWLNTQAVDLVELSGGSYEAPAMQGEARDGRTLAREAYFLEMAADLAKVAQMPLMVTGGIRRLPIVEQVLDSGVAMAGIATALAVEPNLPRHWREGRDSHPQLPPIRWKKKPLAAWQWSNSS